jgi:HJR/Mrr/RecB family endonuclease
LPRGKFSFILFFFQILKKKKKPELSGGESRIAVARGWRVEEVGRCWSKVTNVQLQNE